MDRIGILCSGGDAPGMNAVIRSVVRSARAKGMSVVGIKHGYNGTLLMKKNPTDDFEDLNNRMVGDIIHRGGTFLKTARCLEFKKHENQYKAIENMKGKGLQGLIVVGGDGTFMGAYHLTKKGFPTVGVPGTIDNDLPFTDYTVGFDTAVNTVCDAINRIRDTSTSHDRVSIVEVMGRACGDIALHAGLASGAECILVPEMPWSIRTIADKISESMHKGKNTSIIVVAEGAWESMEEFDVQKFYADNDMKYHPYITMDSKTLSEIIQKITNADTRATVLGHVQRGGSPSSFDRNLASMLGARAVELLHDGKGGQVVGIKENVIINVPIEVAVDFKKPAGPNGIVELTDKDIQDIATYKASVEEKRARNAEIMALAEILAQ